MKKRISFFGLFLCLAFGWANPGHYVDASEPIKLGVPTSLGFLEGKEGLFSVNMAVDEINRSGGVNVAGVKRKFEVIAIDARGGEPGSLSPMSSGPIKS